MKPGARTLLKKQVGLSLVEMMIALAIGLFMTSIIAGLFLNMRSSFRYQEDFARLQESGRFAMEALTRDIRMAGYNGCGTLTDFANVVNGGLGDPFLNFQTPVLGYEGGSLPSVLTGAGASNSAPASGSARYRQPIPDAIILLGVDSSSELVVQSHNPNSAQIDTSSHSIAAGEILLITDCSHTALFQMTGPSSATKTNVVHNTGTGTPGNCYKFLGASCDYSSKSYQYKPGASLMRVYSNAYFIAPSSSGSGQSLWSMSLTGQTTGTSIANELIKNVDNMQLKYGLDTNGDRSADQFLVANSVADWSKVVAVQASILVSTEKDGISSGPQTYDFDGTPILAADRRVRKTFTESITVRNRTP